MIFIFLLFMLIAMPLLELALIIQTGSVIGVWNTIGALILIAMLGLALSRRQGSRLWVQMQAELSAGRLPADSVLHGVMVFLAGLLFMAPGFISDFFGLLLVLPLTRYLIVLMFKLWLLRQIQKGSVRIFASMDGRFRDVTQPAPPRDVSPRLVSGRDEDSN